VANGITSGSFGIGVLSDSALFTDVVSQLDTVVSTFTVGGLTAPTTLVDATFDYEASAPTVHVVPPIVPGTPIVLLPSVPEPSSIALDIAGLCLIAGLRKARPLAKT
jgi:hypothetical protein